MTELPMFPLGTVLLPTMVLPLHIFEPRYRALARHCVDGGDEFGVVLIERGSEVGGNDVRTDVGTAARILRAEELPDGRWAIVAVGVRRIRIERWLDDAPYPRAEVDDWVDDEASGGAADALASVVSTLRRALALKAELREPAADATIELSDDPLLGSYQAVAVAPIGPLDQHSLLGAAGPDERLSRLQALLDEEESFLRTRLALG